MRAFGGQESEPVLEASFEVGLFFPFSSNVTLAIHGTPNEHEHGWELISAGSYVREHAVVECVELLLACHVPERHSDSLFFDGLHLDSFCAFSSKQGSQSIPLSPIDGAHGGYKGSLSCAKQNAVQVLVPPVRLAIHSCFVVAASLKSNIRSLLPHSQARCSSSGPYDQ